MTSPPLSRLIPSLKLGFGIFSALVLDVTMNSSSSSSDGFFLYFTVYLRNIKITNSTISLNFFHTQFEIAIFWSSLMMNQ